MRSQLWLIPILFTALLSGLFYFAPATRRADFQVRIRARLNALLITAIALVVLANVAYIYWRTPSLSWIAWGALLLSVAFLGWVLLSPPPSAKNTEEDRGPL
jgi:hypothetical protein